jgi:excisionase family DNA binding protein
VSALGEALLDSLDADDLARLRDLLAVDKTEIIEQPADRLLTPAEAAQRIGVNVETVRRAVRSGALPAARIGRAVRIAEDDLATWLEGGRRRKRTPGQTKPPRTRSKTVHGRRTGQKVGPGPLARALAALE